MDVIIADPKTAVSLPGVLSIPSNPAGMVLFAHGSGSSRLSKRNQFVANALYDAGLATLLFDLLTPDESEYRANVFDIPLLAERLIMATQFIQKHTESSNLAIGYFGASTGAAAALWAAASLGVDISAVVSRGGRPDLASSRLGSVICPTLLLVGSLDKAVIDLNRKVMGLLPDADLQIIPGASHLFEEPGTLEKVAKLSAEWFIDYLGLATFKGAA